MKTLLFTFFLNAVCVLCHAQFITMWDMSVQGQSQSTIIFFAETNGACNYTWTTVPGGTQVGSGSFTSVGAGPSAIFIAVPASQKVRLTIDSTNLKIFAANGGNLVDIVQWGKVKWTRMQFAFYQCTNLQISATDIPNLSNVKSLDHMFDGCTSLVGPSNIGNWDISSVTNLSYMFADAHSFNQPLNNWNTSNVENMQYTFAGALAFNEQIGNWNTSKVGNMYGLFINAKSFNKPIGNWNTSSVFNMRDMFRNAVAFNQEIDTWNTSNVSTMQDMFRGAVAFNKYINSWNVSKVQDFSGMFEYATSFDQTLGNWNTSSAYTMQRMFKNAVKFSGDISNFKTRTVADLSEMFYNAKSFNSSLNSFRLRVDGGQIYQFSVKLDNFLDSSRLDCLNYSNLLNAWKKDVDSIVNYYKSQTFPSYLAGYELKLGAKGLLFNISSVPARKFFDDTLIWTITGDKLTTGPCVHPVSIIDEQNIENDFDCFPNPAHNIISLNIQSGLVAQLIDPIGNILCEKKVKGNFCQFDVSALPSALYFIRVGEKVKKVMVQH